MPKFLILDLIDRRKNIKSTIQNSKILRFVNDLKNYPKLKRDLLKNYTKYMVEMEKEKIIEHIGGYYVT